MASSTFRQGDRVRINKHDTLGGVRGVILCKHPTVRAAVYKVGLDTPMHGMHNWWVRADHLEKTDGLLDV